MKNRQYLNNHDFEFVDNVWQIEGVKVSDFLEKFLCPLNVDGFATILKYQNNSWEDFIFAAIDSFMYDKKVYEYNIVYRETTGRERDKYKAADTFSLEFEKNNGYVNRFNLILR